jgi:hypothetical protein
MDCKEYWATNWFKSVEVKQNLNELTEKYQDFNENLLKKLGTM